MIINMTGGGGGAGATLVVTGVVGSICTVSKGTKTYTKTFGADAKATFKGLTTGTWTVTMTNGARTAVKTIVINADYTLTITYFSATINVTYPAESTCTATDGSTTLNAPDTTGTWACIVPNAGTWTVSCTDGTQTASKTVSITAEGQAATVKLAYNLRLFDNGDECTDVTGGWTISDYQFGYPPASDMLIKPTITDRILLYGQDEAQVVGMGTANSIDLTGYSKLSIDFETLGTYGVYTSGTLYLLPDKIANQYQAVAKLEFGNDIGARKVETIDVSSINTPVYVFLWATHEASLTSYKTDIFDIHADK